MRTVTGYVIETLTVQKEVEVQVPLDADDEQVRAALRDKAYEKLVTSGSDWEIINSNGVSVEIS